MKRVKVMLTAIAVLAVVGGAVAFKAKTYGQVKYCTSTSGGGSCPNSLNTSTTIGTQNATQYYYNLTNGTSTPCSNVNCIATSTTFYSE